MSEGKTLEERVANLEKLLAKTIVISASLAQKAYNQDAEYAKIKENLKEITEILDKIVENIDVIDEGTSGTITN